MSSSNLGNFIIKYLFNLCLNNLHFHSLFILYFNCFSYMGFTLIYHILLCNLYLLLVRLDIILYIEFLEFKLKSCFGSYYLI